MEVHVLQVIGLVLLVEFLAQADKQVVVLDRVGDGGQLLRDLSLVEQVCHFRPIILVSGTECVRDTALPVSLESPRGGGICR